MMKKASLFSAVVCCISVVAARINTPKSNTLRIHRKFPRATVLRSLQQLSDEAQEAVDLILNPPVLKLIAEEDEDGAMPLGLCQGDCDSDDDCEGDLICFQRGDGDPAPPGCSIGSSLDGGATVTVTRQGVDVTSLEGNDQDFCVFPTVDVVGSNPVPDEGEVTDDAPIDTDEIPLSRCQADCDSDSECGEGLVCYFRAALVDPVPGCTVDNEERIIDGDFCVPEIYKDTESYLNPPTDAPTLGPTTQFQFQLDLVADDGGPMAAFPLQICQGDCDGDDDCDQGLVCLARSDVSDPVSMYCTGTPVDDKDYCVPAPGVNMEQLMANMTTMFNMTTFNNNTGSSTMDMDDDEAVPAVPAPPVSTGSVSVQVPGSASYGSVSVSIPTQEPTTTAPEPTANATTAAPAPVADPTPDPTQKPTPEPTKKPTPEPTKAPVTPEPTKKPTADPTPEPTVKPTAESTPEPTAKPTAEPTPRPTEAEPEPTSRPTVGPGPATAPLGTYDDFAWWELPLNVRLAAEDLGYDEESWESQDDLDIDDTCWAELGGDIQDALFVFGYDQDNWDLCDECWSSLTDEQQAAAGVLGYDIDSWNCDSAVPVADLCWVEMTELQQSAAGVLGYDQDSWDQGEC